MNEQYEKPQYSRSRIDKAGKYISKYDEDTDEFKAYLPVVDNWRAAHAYALDCISKIVNDVIEEDKYVCVHRLKRLDSIIGKLKRHNNTGLYRMQDLGGCRVIVDDISSIESVVERIEEQLIESGHEIYREDDYITSPRSNSGYRSYHIIVKFHSNDELLWDGMFIEIQVRTKIEHAWATAVEIMDIISNETLKAGTGNEQYMRFFKLVSALFSIDEGTAIVEGVSSDRSIIAEEINNIDRKEKIREKLATYNQVIDVVNSDREPDENTGYFLLIVHKLENTLTLIPFSKSNVEEATNTYQEMEKNRRNESLDIALVSVNRLDNIKDAYPNYFMMTLDFLNRLDSMCPKIFEKPSLPFTSKNKGKKISDVFSVSYFNSNVPRSIRISDDTVGAETGSIYCIPHHNMTLEGSYLRLSAPIWHVDTEVNINPYTVQNPGIIVTHTGGCYFVDQNEWSFVCGERTILIQSRDINALKVLLCWMKSNLFMWDLLWNYHSRTVCDREVIENIYYPDLSHEAAINVIKYVDEIIKREYEFVYKVSYNDYSSFEETDSFNEMISSLLASTDEIFGQYYELSQEQISIIKKELSIKGYFTYE